MCSAVYGKGNDVVPSSLFDLTASILLVTKTLSTVVEFDKNVNNSLNINNCGRKRVRDVVQIDGDNVPSESNHPLSKIQLQGLIQACLGFCQLSQQWSDISSLLKSIKNGEIDMYFVYK